MSETEAFDLVYKWCCDNDMCMRKRNGECKIVDNQRFSAPILYSGPNWVAIWKSIEG